MSLRSGPCSFISSSSHPGSRVNRNCIVWQLSPMRLVHLDRYKFAGLISSPRVKFHEPYYDIRATYLAIQSSTLFAAPAVPHFLPASIDWEMTLMDQILHQM